MHFYSIKLLTFKKSSLISEFLMADRERQQSWSEFLDSKRENILFVRFVFSQDFKSVEEFAVIYVSIMDDKTRQILRYDCSVFEGVHVHQFYKKPLAKKYLKMEKSFDAIEELVRTVREKWAVFLSEFKEN